VREGKVGWQEASEVVDVVDVASGGIKLRNDDEEREEAVCRREGR